MLEESYMASFTNKLDSLIDKEDWTKAKKLLKKELERYPKEYFLITSLSKVYYNSKDYKNAIRLAEQAYEIEPDDVLVVYDYGCALDASKMNRKAIEKWDIILSKDIEEIAFGEFGEGMKWAKSMINDTRFRKALSLFEIKNFKEAKNLIEDHLNNRRRGIYSDFSLKEVRSVHDKILQKLLSS